MTSKKQAPNLHRIGIPKLCRHRNYMNKSFLSPNQLCPGCKYEQGDLFTGTAGHSLYGYYCIFNPNGEPK